MKEKKFAEKKQKINTSIFFQCHDTRFRLKIIFNNKNWKQILHFLTFIKNLFYNNSIWTQSRRHHQACNFMSTEFHFWLERKAQRVSDTREKVLFQ